MDDLIALEPRIAHLNNRRWNWKWAPIDPLQPIEQEIFDVVAEMSGTEIHQQSNMSTQQILANYHKSAHFREAVESRLSEE